MGFGDFDTICQNTALAFCVLVGPPSSLSGTTGIQATCYARSIELANTIIFEGAASFIHIIALVMTVIMIIHVRSKFTAVGTSAYRFLINCLQFYHLSLTIPSSRPQRNHYLLLPLHAPHRL